MSLLQLAAAVTAAATPPPEVWEVMKGVLLFVITGLLGLVARRAEALVKRVDKALERQVDLEHIVVGVDGKNGLRSKVAVLEADVEHIHVRNAKIDAITEYERQQYPGEDRRAGPRRMRDVLHEAEDITHREAP